jgi:hypothetical protein
VGLELLVLSSLVFQLCSVLGVQSCDRLYECACFLYSLSMRYSCISSCIFFRFLFTISPKPKVPKCSQYLTCKSGVHYLLLARASLSSLFFSLSPGASFTLIYLVFNSSSLFAHSTHLHILLPDSPWANPRPKQAMPSSILPTVPFCALTSSLPLVPESCELQAHVLSSVFGCAVAWKLRHQTKVLSALLSLSAVP